MSHRPYLLSGLASVALIASVTAPPAYAQQLYDFDIPAQDLGSALRTFARTSGVQVIFDGGALRGKRSARYRQRAAPEAALQTILRGTGMSFRRDGGIYVIVPADTPVRPTASAAPPTTPAPAPAVPQDAVAEEDAEVIVTAQKRAERIIDVPIAMTALSGSALDDRKIEGGSELLRAVPNVTFSKSNFSMYNFSIRGIGTKAISASSDPAVAVSFNNTPLVRNRLFESEFFDLQRVEVLRGPQGTLYGRNATAGVVNMIPALPGRDFALEAKLEVGSFDTMRASGMLNVPLSDTLGVRVAGAFTSREGFDYNSFTQRRVNGRELWSTRATLAWEPSDRFRANLIWQHFEEDDNRSRTGKQLCTPDPGPATVGGIAVTDPLTRGRMSQGCLPGSLYDDAAFGAPNGNALSYIFVPNTISIGRDPVTRAQVNVVKLGDPFAGVVQSRNLREIATSYDPVFRAKNDVVQLNLEFEPSDGLKLVSQTAYSRDRFYSTQDYNRFVSNPIFNSSTQPLLNSRNQLIDPVAFPGPTPGGMYCDPQLGCSDRLVSADLSRSANRQWSQELRLQSSFDGPVNFNIGANYLDFKSQDDYYVFNNMFTLISEWFYGTSVVGGNTVQLPCPLGFEGRECVYVDRNPIGSLDNQGHNYFLSQNGIRIKSYAGFGELYWNLSSNLKVTAGLRYTRDEKVSTQVPSQLLLGGGTQTPLPGSNTGGRVNSGYPALPDIEQAWSEFTGRLVLDWKPNLSFTDDTLIYASASRGYKGGGANPPRVDINPAIVQYQPLAQTFRPEYLNAFEVGIKNSFGSGRFMLNGTAFYYDYKDYQISQIVDRIAFNENFDATIWGLEFEAAWRPSRAFRLDANLGYLKTRLKEGSQSIDVMNRTQGDPDWMVLRPWLQAPSNCVAPRAFVERIMRGAAALRNLALSALCPGSNRIGSYNPGFPGGIPYHALYGFTYDYTAPYNPATVGLNINQGGSGAPNGGRGFAADLGGNELPNSPRLTFNVGAQYTFFVDAGNWELTFRGDYYRQSESFARIYNTEYDRLKAWDNLNLAVTLARPSSGLTFQLYVKNVFDDAPITDFFTNADDTGLSANVFTLDPRIIGFSMSKKF
ncbi:TonB-dependent receptor [Sphingomonas koreensis]|nr:TonB-dependent receptor-like protein [Sphingomonas koreensis]RSU61291.1 TonB-dependent receptor [Sphingomonas koreensis]RSU69935.1 TonB-dependent receptor [Sphingomonas koreensis]